MNCFRCGRLECYMLRIWSVFLDTINSRHTREHSHHNQRESLNVFLAILYSGIDEEHTNASLEPWMRNTADITSDGPSRAAVTTSKWNFLDFLDYLWCFLGAGTMQSDQNEQRIFGVAKNAWNSTFFPSISRLIIFELHCLCQCASADCWLNQMSVYINGFQKN